MSSEMLSKLTIEEESIVHPGERVDDLECNGFRIIQNPSFFCFGMDAILLSDFAYSGDRDKYCGEKWDQEEKDKGPKIYKCVISVQEQVSFPCFYWPREKLEM